MFMSVISISFESASRDAYVAVTNLVRPLIVVMVVPETISVEPSVGAEYALAELIAAQAEPVHTDISPVAELKYNAPVSNAFPSLSNVGGVVLDPRYLSSNWSYTVAALEAEVCAELAEVAAEDAEVDADVALVAAACAWYLAENSPPATAPVVLVAQSLAKVADAVASVELDAAAVADAAAEVALVAAAVALLAALVALVAAAVCDVKALDADVAAEVALVAAAVAELAALVADV